MEQDDTRREANQKPSLGLVTPQGTSDGNTVVITATTCLNSSLQQDQEEVWSKAFQEFLLTVPTTQNKVCIPNGAS